ncbi:MAG TPA: type II secretion system F family protein [Candidatus Eisenbacteria bacterium]|nr:type II secretion system F family protein [Candidatus Eisenbacteria bacterium]
MTLKRITLSSSELLNLVSNLSTMLSAGIPILSAIHSLGEEARGNTKKILTEISADLLKGKHLFESLAKFPYVFDTITVNMVRASEQSGTLDIILKDMKEQIKNDIIFNRKIRSALTYPFLVLLVFVAVLLLILVVVMPKIATVFTQLKVKLPLPTKILIFASNVLTHQTIFVIAGLMVLGVGAFLLYRFQKKRVLSFFYKLPLISPLIRDIDLMHFTRSLHLLLNSGTSITTALELTESVVQRPDVARAIAHAKQTILTGKTLSSSFKMHKKIFPGTLIELTQAGEKTGSLAKSLEDISEYLDYRITDTLAVLTALLEPIMLVVVAVMVGSMMVAIIGPIYGLIGQIGAH